MPSVLHVSILGENEIVREGLRRILIDQGIAVVAAESSCADLGELICDVIIIDAPDLEAGIQSCLDLQERYPSCRMLLMMDHYRIEDVARAFTTGAIHGYLVKRISCAPLAAALRLIAMGEKVLPSEVAESLAQSGPQFMWSGREASLPGPRMSNRETEILRCLVDGDPNKRISRRLGIADATVKIHLKAILRKLQLRNRTQAALWAANRGFLTPIERQGASGRAAAPLRTEALITVASAC